MAKMKTILFGGRAFRLEPVFATREGEDPRGSQLEAQLIGYQVFEYLDFVAAPTGDDPEAFRTWYHRLKRPCPPQSDEEVRTKPERFI